MRIVLVLLLLTGQAWGDEPPPEVIDFDHNMGAGSWAVAADARLVTHDGQSGAVGAHAALTYDVPLCRVLDLDADGELLMAADSEPLLSGSLRVGGCAPLVAMAAGMSFTDSVDVRPSLLRLPTRAPVRFSGWALGMTFLAVRFPWQTSGGEATLDIGVTTADFSQVVGDPETSYQIGMDTFRLTLPGEGAGGLDQVWSGLHLELHGVSHEDPAVYEPQVLRMDALRVDALPVGGRVSLRAGAGLQVLSLEDTPPDHAPDTPTPPDPTPGLSRITVGYDVAIDVALHRGVSLTGFAGSVAEPVVSSRGLDGHKAGVSVGLARPRFTATATAQVQHLNFVDHLGVLGHANLLGGQASAAYQLRPHVRAFASGEVVSTAGLPEDLTAGAAWLGQGTLGLAVDVDHRW